MIFIGVRLTLKLFSLILSLNLMSGIVIYRSKAKNSFVSQFLANLEVIIHFVNSFRLNSGLVLIYLRLDIIVYIFWQISCIKIIGLWFRVGVIK